MSVPSPHRAHDSATEGKHIQLSHPEGPRRQETLAFEVAPLVGQRMDEHREPVSWGLGVALLGIFGGLLEGILDII